MDKFYKIWYKIPEEYRGIVLFLICLFGTHFLWELTIRGDEDESAIVTFCGADISCLFEYSKLWFASKTHDGLSLFAIDTQLTMESVSFSNGHGCSIIAGCTAIKQFVMMTMILLCSRGRFIHKLWYLGVSIVVLIGYNILRLMVLTYVVRDHEEMFEFMHIYVLKYIFYGLMFLLWLLWDEWLRKVLK